MTRYAGSPQEFIQSLPWTLPIKWQGKSGIYDMGENRIATIKLNTHGTHDHYLGFTVEITSKIHGPIKIKWFGFDEYLKRSDRKDTRSDYPLGSNSCFCVLGYCGWEWYIAIPSKPQDFTKEVELWIMCWV